MSEVESNNTSQKSLRQKSEIILKKKELLTEAKLSHADTLKLFHELQVYQVELELQNEEISQAHLVAQQAANRYTELYDFSPTSYFTLSQDGTIFELNISGASLFGETRSNVKNQKFENYLTAESRIRFKDFLNTVNTTKTKQSIEIDVHHLKTKSTIYVSAALNETKNQFFISAVDITALKRLEKNLTEALKKAEESENLKTAFLQNLRHEIRTPMNAIIGFSNYLKEDNVSEKKRKEFAGIVSNSANQLLTIINDVISVSLLETSQEKINDSEVCLNDLLAELYIIFSSKLETKALKLKMIKGLNDAESYCITDKSKLTQVISNLLSNALKFTHQGEIEFGYSLKEDGLLFFVKDSGIGVERDKQELIFDRFRQANTDTKMHYGGTGLGLSIAKGLVDLLKGTIWIESEVNKGATFYFRIPFIKAPPQIITKTKKAHDKLVILIADDEEVIFYFLNIALKQAFNCDTYQAKNGEEAINIIKENPNINVALMDINMPVLSGYEAAKRIKEFRPDLHIIAQTGYDLDSEKGKYESGIFNDYIAKPINEKVLILKLKSY